MAAFCTKCSAPQSNNTAKFCIKCGTAFPLATALVVSSPDSTRAASLEFMATDLVLIEDQWKHNRELLRGNDFLWNLIGRDVSDFQLHYAIKRMQGELEKMDEQTYLGHQALRRQHSLEQARSGDVLHLAQQTLRGIVQVYGALLLEVQRMVNGLNLSDEAREDITTILINQIIVPQLCNVVAQGHTTLPTDVMTEVQRLLIQRIENLLPDKEGEND